MPDVKCDSCGLSLELTGTGGFVTCDCENQFMWGDRVLDDLPEEELLRRFKETKAAQVQLDEEQTALNARYETVASELRDLKKALTRKLGL